MEEKDTKLSEIWIDFWKKSRFFRSLWLLGKAICASVALGWCRMWELFRKYPEPPICVLFILLVLSNLVWFTRYRVLSNTKDSVRFEVERNIDQKIIKAEAEGHSRALLEVKLKEDARKDSIEQAKRDQRMKWIMQQKKEKEEQQNDTTK